LEVLGKFRLGYVTLRLVGITVGKICFVFDFILHTCIHRRRMRIYQNTASAILHRYDILYGGHKSDAGVGSGRRRRFLN
jgi:tRNA A58 N-methylase Trm61